MLPGLILSPGLCRKHIQNVQGSAFEGLCCIFPWFVKQCLHTATGIGDGQHVPLSFQPPGPGYSRTRLWLRTICALLTEEISEQQPPPLTHENVLEAFCWLRSLKLHSRASSGYTTTSIPVSPVCFSAHSVLFHRAVVTIMMLYVPCTVWYSSSSDQKKRMEECSVQCNPSALFLQEHWEFPGFQWCNALYFCPTTQCTFPLIQTLACIVRIF